jgi:hypothetical protein
MRCSESHPVRCLLTLLAGSLLALIPATLRADGPTYGVRVYEVFQRGAEVRLEERTSRAFAPRHVRNLAVGEAFPPEGQPGIKVYRSRDSFGFFGSYWREDGEREVTQYVVEVTDLGGGDEPGTTYVRVKLVPRSDEFKAARRDVKHPVHDDRQRAATAASGK